MPTTSAARRHRAAKPEMTETYLTTLHRLAGAQKTTKGAPAYSRFVNRRLGRYLAAAAYHAGLSPNQVTVLSAVFSFAAIGMLAGLPATWWVGVLVSVALLLGYALDSADGQLARLRGGGSTSGEWLDHVIDATKISALHLAVLVTTYRHFRMAHDEFFLVPIGFTVIAAVLFFAMILNDQLRCIAAYRNPARPVPAPPSNPSTLRALIVIPVDYGVFCLLFVMLGFHGGFLTVYTLLFFANAAFAVLALSKWFADMRQLDAAG